MGQALFSVFLTSIPTLIRGRAGRAGPKKFKCTSHMAENFRWKGDGAPLAVTKRFILPEEKRPQLAEVQTPEQVPLPVIDMGEGTDVEMAERMARASEEFGFFKIINHGFPEEVWRRAVESLRELFLLPAEVKARFPGEGTTDAVKLFTYYNNGWEDGRRVYMWSEVVKHPWHPTNDFTTDFPDEISAAYREHMGAYAREMGVLMTRLLSLLSKGLGLDQDCLKKKLGENPDYLCSGNYYPACPNPELTIGLPTHSDSLALSVVRTLDSVPGLQIRHGEDWVAVGKHPNSFTINIGDQLQVLSNRRYKSVDHRVVSNDSSARVTLACFWGPAKDVTIGPIEDLVDEEHPPAYRSYTYDEFYEVYYSLTGKRRDAKRNFELHP